MSLRQLALERLAKISAGRDSTEHKCPEGQSPGVSHGTLHRRVPWDSAEGAQGHGTAEIVGTTGTGGTDAYEERAAILEYEAGLPRSWAEPFARLLTSGPPGDYSPRRWSAAVDGALRFADKWAAKAHALGWDSSDVFGLHSTHPAARRDPKGLAWLLSDGAVVTVIDADGADIRMRSGAQQRFYKKSP